MRRLRAHPPMQRVRITGRHAGVWPNFPTCSFQRRAGRISCRYELLSWWVATIRATKSGGQQVEIG